MIYSPLNQDEIRLIKLHRGKQDDMIRCSISVVQQHKAPSFEALSYVWGTCANTKTILLNGIQYRITQRLQEAMLYLRSSSKDRLLWIDALAINQSKTPERNTQVAKMRIIYSLATTVLIWLGPFKESDEVLFREINQINGFAMSQGIDIDGHSWMARLNDKEREHQVVGLSKIAMMDYWTRVWVVQELMYARQVEVVLGSQSLTFAALSLYWNAVSTYLHDTEGKSDRLLPNNICTQTLKIMGLNSMPEPGTALQQHFLSLEQWLDMVPLKRCSDPRDMIYGFHGCFPPNLRNRIPIDYSKRVDEVFVSMTILIIETSNQLDIILLGVYDTSPVAAHRQNRPSWVPDFQHIAMDREILKVLSARATGSLKPDYSFKNDNTILCTKGIQLGIIQRITPTIRYLDRAERLVSAPSSQEIMEHLRHIFQILEVSSEPLESTLQLVVAFSRNAATTELLISLFIEDYVPQLDCRIALMLREFTEGNRIFSIRGKIAQNHTIYGIAACQLREGDHIYLLLGCTVPVILRQVEEQYSVVGWAYIPEYIWGEAVRGIELGIERPIDVLIC